VSELEWQLEWQARRIRELERIIVKIRRVGREQYTDLNEQVIDMRSHACFPRIDESKYKEES